MTTRTEAGAMEQTAPLVQTLGYVSYKVTDLDEAIDFYQRYAHLELTARRDDVAYLRGGTDHHWLRLRAAEEAGLERVAYQAVDQQAYEELRRRLIDLGIDWKSSEDALATDYVTEWIRFRDLDGVEIEVYPQMVEMPVAARPGPVRLVANLHAVLRVADPVAATDFYQRLLGFRVSDWIERWGSFLRCGNRYHHSLALFQADEHSNELDHFCMLVEDIDDVMRARSIALRAGVRLRTDLLRHAASGGIGVYFVDSRHDGLVFEFATWHRAIDDEDHRPRIMPLSPSTLDVWHVD